MSTAGKEETAITSPVAVAAKSLRERIAEVNAADDRDKAENDAKFAEKMRRDLKEQLRDRLAVEVDESAITMRDDNMPLVEVEGFRFSIGNEGELVMLVAHEPCGKEYDRVIWSINSMADRYVPYPHTNNWCLEKEQSPTSLTTELRLLQALRDFIAEQGYQPE